MERILTLKQARLIAEVNQVEVARAIGVSRYTYMQLEKNPDKATVAQAKAISKFLNVPYDEIFFGTAST